MVQFPAFPHIRYVFTHMQQEINLVGFPHSEIRGSRFTCNSPRLIAAYYVLLRCLVPRHPPYALCSLIVCFNYTYKIVRFILLKTRRNYKFNVFCVDTYTNKKLYQIFEY